LLTSLYMFRLWYMTFFGELRTTDAHPHESPWSMRVPLIILALLSICGGWIGVERFDSFLAPSVGLHPAVSAVPHLELILSIVAVLVALEGWLIADKYYRRKTERPAQIVAAMPGSYKLIANKYYVDEFYNAALIKPLFAISQYILGWVVDTAILGGIAWLLAGAATFTGMILQRWQSGNLRSYAAWLAAAAAAVLLYALIAQGTIPASGAFTHITQITGAGH
jgi:NADH-quinone oxidoreductase subunit L